ncbi:hypothetical protein CKO11_13995 [Rhodobacter sp. TJ_12]|uniref:hypothetical protein n=1 Tax=Rhodobacter sp. TJ_12 TaxID=2029399 RepID=UPI001CBFB2A2|nr:hypothetical protein [Rhodobacter sp. TJ_12]MBZ4023570.1 hypothetical protein [Rhodobacter sp. TJ_12]
MTASAPTRPDRQTEAQSHAEIQALLREEIAALKTMLDARFQEIATLTRQLEALDAAREENMAQQIEDLRRRHALELKLADIRHANWQNGPAAGVPDFSVQIELLTGSELFDPSWYLQTYPDLAGSGMSPIEHYVRAGAFEGRNPGPDFDTMAYYLANRDIADAGWPALVHYVMYGQAEGRSRG